MPGKSGQIDHLSAVHKGPRCRGSPPIFPFPAIAIRTNSEDGSKHSFSQWGSDESNVTKKAIRWNRTSEAEKVRFLQRFEFVRYHLLYLASYAL
jgi:hypothetical protein